MGIVAKNGPGSDTVRCACHGVESLQMASLSWRYHSVVRAVVHMIRKGRARWVRKDDPLAQLQFIDELFGLAI